MAKVKDTKTYEDYSDNVIDNLQEYLKGKAIDGSDASFGNPEVKMDVENKNIIRFKVEGAMDNKITITAVLTHNADNLEIEYEAKLLGFGPFVKKWCKKAIEQLHQLIEIPISNKFFGICPLDDKSYNYLKSLIFEKISENGHANVSGLKSQLVYHDENESKSKEENGLITALSETGDANSTLDKIIQISDTFDKCIEYFGKENKYKVINIWLSSKDRYNTEAIEENDYNQLDDMLYKDMPGYMGRDIYDINYFDDMRLMEEQVDELVKSDIKELLIEKGIKITVSDINAYLKHQDLEEIKKYCEELYNDGEISFAGNGRYFVLTEGQEKPKKTSAPKSEEIDVEKELEKLKGLLDKGLITQEDYDAKKKELLGL